MSRKKLYLALAFAGAIVPYLFFIQFFSDAGLSLSGFLAAVFANPAAGGFTADLVISSLVFWLFMWQRRSRDAGPNPAWFVIINLTIGLSCALPAYLYASEPADG